MLREGREKFPQDYRVNLYCRSWVADRYWLTGNLAARRSDKHLLTVPFFSVLLETRHIISGNERSDTFVLDDPKPATIELSQLFFEPIESRMRKFQFLRNRARVNAERSLATAQSLLFVCYGHICRSPFAEKIAQSELSITVHSAGTHLQQGRESPPEALAAARNQGVNLSDHRSKVITKAMIEDADVILVFDLRNERDILAQFPNSKTKVHLIACLDDCGDDIDDPFGKGIDCYDFCYRRIAKIIRNISLLTNSSSLLEVGR